MRDLDIFFDFFFKNKMENFYNNEDLFEFYIYRTKIKGKSFEFVSVCVILVVFNYKLIFNCCKILQNH